MQQLRTYELSQPSEGRNVSEFKTEIAGKIKLTKIRILGLQKQKEFLESDKAKLLVEAPISGVVTTSNLKQRLDARPVNRGNHLVSIANDEGPWELVLLVPEEIMGYVRSSDLDSESPLQVRFRMASDGTKTYQGRVSEIDFRTSSRTEVVPGSSSVEVTVDFDKNEIGSSLRLNSQVHARIDCGMRTRFFLYTYQIRDKVRRWLFY